MSAETYGAILAPSTPSSRRQPGIPFSRVLNIETRKQLDTRAGRGIFIAFLLMATVMIGLAIYAAYRAEEAIAFDMLINSTAGIASLLIPMISIMAVTSEWSQRTHLVTFTMEPNRFKVVFGKIVASLLLTVVSFLALVMLSLTIAFIAGLFLEAGSILTIPWRTTLGMLLVLLLLTLFGSAFGVLFQNTPLAIVAYWALPTVFTLVASLVPAIAKATSWIDISMAQQPIFELEMTGTEAGQLATSFSIWILLPLVVGLARLMKKEIK